MRGDRFVYFVRRADGEGPVKIGCSSYPETRLSTLQTWAPYPLVTAATIPGDEGLERRFHALFAAQHSHREWFHWSPELALVIAQIQLGIFDAEALPAPKCVTSNPTKTVVSANSKLGMSWGQRLRHLKNRGVEVPVEVTKAAFRWGAGPCFRDHDPHNPRDRAIVEAFLAGHPRLADVRRAA